MIYLLINDLYLSKFIIQIKISNKLFLFLIFFQLINGLLLFVNFLEKILSFDRLFANLYIIAIIFLLINLIK